MASKKKILLITRSFYPHNSARSIRSSELAIEFARQGHDITVLTFKEPGQERYAEEFGIKFKYMRYPRWKAVKVKGKGPELLFRRLLARFSKLLVEYPDIEIMYAVSRALKAESGYDLLISVAVPYPIHWGVARVRTPKHRIAEVWAADCGDPYMGNLSDSFKKPFYFAYLEKNFCRKADYVVVPIEGAKAAYYPEFQDKLEVIPQGLFFPELDRTPPESEVVSFAYAGNIRSYLHYARPFFEYLEKCGKEFKFVIVTRDKEVFLNGLPNSRAKLEFHDYMPREALLQLLSRQHFLVHFPYLNNRQKSLKLVDYMYTGRPILSYEATEKDHEKLGNYLSGDFSEVEDFGSIEPYRAENVALAFTRLAERKPPSAMVLDQSELRSQEQP